MPLSAPVTACAVERSSGKLGRAGAAAMQGIRNHFEDAHVLDQELGICAVYDGHLGDAAAAFCAERLHLHIGAAGPPSRESLPAAFAAADSELRAGNLPEGSESGSTATVAMVQQDGQDRLRIWVASAGDSRALLWRKADGKIEATHDHRPSDPEERKRIEAAGGTVTEEFDPPRIDGALACSRALGAFKFKQGSGGPGQQKVSSVPEVYEWQASKGDWLILACDGVWDTFSSERVVDEICKKADGDLGDALANLLKLCIDKEADDNLTVMAIELGAATEQAKKTVNVSAGDFLKVKDKEVLEHYSAFCLRYGFELKKEMVPKAPPKAALTEATPVPGPRYAALAPPECAAVTNGVGHAEDAPKAKAAKAEKPKDAETQLPPPLVICGPSGVGKGTLIKRLMETFPDKFGFSVSHTTRAPRPGEEDGKDYHFAKLEQMKVDVESGDKFIESAHVHGNIYGTSKAAVEDVRGRKQICILDIDVQGVKQVKEKSVWKETRFVFVAPPSFETLETRLRGRGTETEEKIQTRLKNARAELDYGQSEGTFDKVLVNDDLVVAEKELFSKLREWYGSMLVQQVRVTMQRSVGFYKNIAKEFFEGSDKKTAVPQLEVTALGNAISAAMQVVTSLTSDGHKLACLETSTATVESRGRTQTAPRFSAVLYNKAEVGMANGISGQ
eukprot:gnl/TRDRNA2_/TRDRNA2_66155_c0_seq1.p1 gnl/TRDRNA2_/TRDRNA2_66155_c0~~gnl/TRDRNA2_/TRDRNA2_66155_c0_seq1.p1  ORF type:complete len:675 (-),score=184.51 gnl/TRDRNA2_/TRDRNA2_66155_c0_seq1:58-2082(-)